MPSDPLSILFLIERSGANEHHLYLRKGGEQMDSMSIVFMAIIGIIALTTGIAKMK